jgi:hypothetical protein
MNGCGQRLRPFTKANWFICHVLAELFAQVTVALTIEAVASDIPDVSGERNLEMRRGAG